MKRFSLVYLLLFCFYAYSQKHLSNAGKLLFDARTSEAIMLPGPLQALVLVNSKATDSAFLANCIHVNAKFGNIWSVSFQPADISLLTNIACVEYAEIAVRTNAARFKNDIERQSTSVDKVQNGIQNGLPMDYSGKGVVVGIVDIGFQCNHPTFYTNDGSRTRIRRYWQQNNQAGPAPQGFAYGTEITDTSLVQLANDMDGTHGTHVAGIAAGSGFSTPGLQYRGMAPGAELVFVSIRYSNDSLGGSALGDYLVANPSILDAYKYIFDYAESIGKPAVINLSWGMHTGPHDGTSLFDKATETLVGKGKILVGANGNEGENLMHLQHQFDHDTIGTIMIENNRQFRPRESVYADFWGSANSEFAIQVEIIDTSKNSIVSTPFVSSFSDSVTVFNLSADASSFRIVFACEKTNPGNLKPNITVMADHMNPRKYAIVARIRSTNSLVHGWNSGGSREWTSGSFRNRLNQIEYENEFIAGNTDYTAGENGGTSKAVISVGAFAARSALMNYKGKWINDSGYVTPGNITRFSSRGPTVDGRIKPDICAPGYDVPSSINNKRIDGWMPDRTLVRTVFRNDTNYWTAFNGTSMASPHVAGIVALMLEGNPQLNAAQVQEILTSTATADQNTGTVPNNQYGYGKVNAYAAVLKALQYAGIDVYPAGNGLSLYPNPASDVLCLGLPALQADASISIISLDGKVIQMLDKELQPHMVYSMRTEGLAAGIYFVRFHNGGQLFVYKFIKT